MGAVHPPIPYSIETIYQQPLSYYLPPFIPRGRSYASISIAIPLGSGAY